MSNGPVDPAHGRAHPGRRLAAQARAGQHHQQRRDRRLVRDARWRRAPSGASCAAPEAAAASCSWWLRSARRRSARRSRTSSRSRSATRCTDRACCYPQAIDGGRRPASRARCRDLPDCPQPDRRRGSRDAADPRRADRHRRDRGAHRYPGVGLDRAAGVEHPRRLHQGSGRPPRGRLRRVEPPRGRLQRARERDALARGASTSPALAARATGADPLPDLVLQGDVGLLPGALATRAARGGASTRCASIRRSRTAR